MTSLHWYFLISVLLLAALLYPLITRIIWVLSVRRLQKKLQRELVEAELTGQRQRARIVSLLLVIPFSLLFNVNLLGLPHG